MSKFSGKRTEQVGQMTVQTGFRSSGLTYRVFLPSVHAVSLTPDQAEDLADALDRALARQEEDPLL